jgi:hypothetical protein
MTNLPSVATSAPPLPAPVRFHGALLWRRADIESWKAKLFGVPEPEIAPTAAGAIVTFEEFREELRLSERTFRRRIREARRAALDHQNSEDAAA